MVGQIVEDIKGGLGADAPPFTLTMSAPESSTCMVQDVLSRTAFELYRYPPKEATSRRQSITSARESHQPGLHGLWSHFLGGGGMVRHDHATVTNQHTHVVVHSQVIGSWLGLVPE